MSNFMSYENAQSVLGEFAEAIKSGGGGSSEPVVNYLIYPYYLPPVRDDGAAFYGNANTASITIYNGSFKRDSNKPGILYIKKKLVSDDAQYTLSITLMQTRLKPRIGTVSDAYLTENIRYYDEFVGKIFSIKGNCAQAVPYISYLNSGKAQISRVEADANGNILIPENNNDEVYYADFGLSITVNNDSPDASSDASIERECKPIISDRIVTDSEWVPYNAIFLNNTQKIIIPLSLLNAAKCTTVRHLLSYQYLLGDELYNSYTIRMFVINLCGSLLFSTNSGGNIDTYKSVCTFSGVFTGLYDGSPHFVVENANASGKYSPCFGCQIETINDTQYIIIGYRPNSTTTAINKNYGYVKIRITRSGMFYNYNWYLEATIEPASSSTQTIKINQALILMDMFFGS